MKNKNQKKIQSSKHKHIPLDKVASAWSIGASIFAMFFGAGNVVFPLILGIQNATHPLAASYGIVMTAVVVPLLGLISIILYSGNYNNFFNEIGRIPGFILITLIMLLIGPFAGIPRAIVVSQATIQALGVSSTPWFFKLIPFSIISCIMIYIFSHKLKNLLQWMSMVFTPIIFGSLLLIIIRGFMISPNQISTQSSITSSFFNGVVSGFNTMDLLASFFFCIVVLISLKQSSESTDKEIDSKDIKPLNHKVSALLIKSSLIATVGLSSLYIAFALIASRLSSHLYNSPAEQVLGIISNLTLGKFKYISGIGMFFACLTTEIALTGIFAEYLHNTIFSTKLSYKNSVLITLAISFLVSIKNFNGICKFLVPALTLCYPALIALTLANIISKTLKIKIAKPLFYSVLTISFIFKLATIAK